MPTIDNEFRTWRAPNHATATWKKDFFPLFVYLFLPSVFLVLFFLLFLASFRIFPSAFPIRIRRYPVRVLQTPLLTLLTANNVLTRGLPVDQMLIKWSLNISLNNFKYLSLAIHTNVRISPWIINPYKLTKCFSIKKKQNKLTI